VEERGGEVVGGTGWKRKRRRGEEEWGEKEGNNFGPPLFQSKLKPCCSENCCC
jgi:hypothetical protein